MCFVLLRNFFAHPSFPPLFFVDVMANAYVSGEGAEFFDAKSFRDAWENSQIGTKECQFSLIAMSTSSTKDEIDALPDAIDLLGDFRTTLPRT